MNEVAEESRQLQNAFIANMTHEIRTPLNVIVGFTTILAETDNLDKEQRVAFLKEINENKDVLLQLVNDLLDYSKIEANTMEYNDGEVDVNALILETCIAENAHFPVCPGHNQGAEGLVLGNDVPKMAVPNLAGF